MTTPRDFYLRRYKPTLDAKQDKYEPFRAVITASDGSRTTGNIWKDEEARQVWYQAWGSGSIGWALCDSIEPWIGLGVIIQFNPLIGFHEVMRDDPIQRSSASNRRSYRALTNADFEQGGRFQLWIDPTMILPLSIYPGSSGLTVSIVSGDYIYDNTRKTYTGVIDYDISAEQPAGPNEHNLVGLYLDSSNALNVITGAAVGTGVTAPEPAWPAGAFRLGVVDMDDTQTTVDILDITNRKVVWTEDNGTLTTGAWPFPGEVNLWDVSTSTVTTYATIVAAAAAAQINDVIIVGAGTYDGAVDLPVPVSLVGIPGQQCIITNNAGAEGYTVRLSAVGALAGGYTISNLRITNGGGNGATDTCILDNASIDTTNYQNIIDSVYLFIDPTPAYAGVSTGIRKTINSRLLIYNTNIKAYTDTPGGGTGNAIHCTAGDTWIYTSFLDGETNEIYATGAGTDVAVPPGTQFVNGNISAVAGGDIFGWKDDFGSLVQLSTSTWLEMFEGAGDGDKVSIFNIVDFATGMTDPGSDLKLVTEKAIVDYGNTNWSGGNVWPLQGHITKNDDGSDYTDFATALAALAGDEQLIIGQAEFTSDNESIPADSSYLGSGDNDWGSVLTTSTAAKVITIDATDAGNTFWRDIKFYNSDTGNDTMAVYAVDGGTHEFVNCTFQTSGDGGWNAYAFGFETGTYTLTFRDCTFICTGGTTNRGVYILSGIGASTINFIDCRITGATAAIDIADSDATINIDGGELTGPLIVTGSTVKLVNVPKITGAITGTPDGWYTDSNGVLKSAGTNDIGSTTAADQTGDIFLAAAKDTFPYADGVGTFKRETNNWLVPGDHFNSWSGWSWAGYAGFVTPSNIVTATYPSLVQIYMATGDGPTARSFAYKGYTTGDRIYSRLVANLDCRAGLRIDDGTNDNYVELFLEYTSALHKLRYRYAIGGAVTGPTDIWTTGYPIEFVSLRLFKSAISGNVFLYYFINHPLYLLTTNFAFSPTPTRGGLYHEHMAGASTPERCSLFDWWLQAAT